MTTYEDVNEAWRPALPLPPVTAKDAAKIYLKLRRAFGTPYRGRGNITPRRVWAAPKGSNSALGNGFQRMVHDASHRVFGILHPTFKTHSAAHAELEHKMITYVIEKGLHLPKVRVKPIASTDKRAAKIASTEAAIKRWTTKQRRATTALKKLNKQLKRLQTAALLAGA